jgi:phosphoglycolate phosphatase
VRRLVLWDIDGTLVDSGGYGRVAFSDAFNQLFGKDPGDLGSLNGRTDLEIALDILERNGIEDPAHHLDGFAEALASSLAEKAALIRERGRAYPGAVEALERLSREPGVVQSLLTGNIEVNAAVKLGAVGLLDHLDLDVGAYGSDHRVRAELVAIARRKAQAKYGIEFTPEETVLIGDTPLDVAAGKEAGVRVIAVAASQYDAETLAASGADIVLEDLVDSEALVRAITTLASRRN